MDYRVVDVCTDWPPIVGPPLDRWTRARAEIDLVLKHQPPG
ncbi:MAG: hypothetical protein ACYDAQ_18035 [Mycobacteriales bacterium]